MDKLIDDAIKEFLSLTITDFKKRKPKSIAEQIAMDLIKATSDENSAVSLKAISMIAERTAGRAIQAEKEFAKESDVAKKINEIYNGG